VLASRTFGDCMRAAFFIGVGLLLATASGCHDARAQKVLEPYTVVPGTPAVDNRTPQVLTDPARDTQNFGVNVPHQCDVFQQVPVRKVDILWVVDSSSSMAPKQARLAANFSGFINQLVTANPPIDFHIGVVTTDTDDLNRRGTLMTWSLAGTTDDYIACTPGGGTVTCNTGGNPSTAVTAFTQITQAVGISGSPQERGLYAAYLALTNPLNVTTQAVDRFIRNDAALYVVVVSDEDDSSCNPLTRQAVCTADPGCHCAPENALQGTGSWGSVAYFTRFFETYKGFGNADSVGVAAIVAVDPDSGVPSQFGDPSPHVGCCKSADGGACPSSGVNDGGYEIAYYGSRYVAVAAATGGVTVNICQTDFSGALSSLGYAASGLRRQFRLTRGPDLKADGGVAEGVVAYVSPSTAANCLVDANCPTVGDVCRNQRCAHRFPVNTALTTNGADYVKCDTAGLRNMINFDGLSVPEPLSTVEVCYDVLASFQNSCP
jgi:hypothetical protein